MGNLRLVLRDRDEIDAWEEELDRQARVRIAVAVVCSIVSLIAIVLLIVGAL